MTQQRLNLLAGVSVAVCWFAFVATWLAAENYNVLTVSKVVTCAKNTRAYSTLRYVFPDGSPFKGVPAAVNSTGDQGQDLPVPPRQQVVSLTC